ncbi:MAG: (Fe-S)-binding protein [Bacteroidia bacterium]|nr:(Fe-S)-binding protein [Bacteroidia bacterium]MCZ2247847.1 (Fe-S)-binding protein [Bacteroidia bacterium]
MISSIIFIILLASASYLFYKNISKIRRNILLGKDIDRKDNPKQRWETMAMIALGQKKMVVRPVAGILHIIVYAGFIIINIEVLEIIIDGIFGTHRVFSFAGVLYNFLIGSFEILALGVALGCAIFLIRRNIIKLKRFASKDLDGWPRSDANYILITEILLMTAFLFMNGSDSILQSRGEAHYIQAGSFPVSSMLSPILSGLTNETLIFIERFCWWFHLVGILAFLNYLPYSKHLHILFAFPVTYFSNLKPKGEFQNLETVTNEVKLMLDPSLTPPPPPETPLKFGVKDVFDLTWKQLLDAYSCTECGRCTSVCPANQTGKLLSPRKILMDTRDRITEVGKNIDTNNGTFADDGKTLLGSYITEEELWACNTCNACTEACPVNLDPLSIIVDMRQYLVMEQSSAPAALNSMFTNIENNGAPWQFSPSDRLNWASED